MTFIQPTAASFSQVYEIDFTTHSNQTINDGNNTLDDGTTWATYNHSFSGTFAIVNGTGLRIITDTFGDWFGSAAGGPGLTASITGELDTEGTVESDYRLYIWFDWIPVTTGFRNTVIGYRSVNGLGQNSIIAGWETASGGQGTNAVLQRKTANSNTDQMRHNDATIFGHRVAIIDLYRRRDWTIYSASTYSGGWPANTTWSFLSAGQWTPDTDMVTTEGPANNDLEVLLALFDLNTATGSELVVKRLRLDRR
jgi:hypothetical protein